MGQLRCLAVGLEPSRELLGNALQRAFPDRELDCAYVDTISALEQELSHAYDIIITERSLEGVELLEMLEDIRCSAPESVLVMWTAVGDERLAVAALKDGFDDYVVRGEDAEPLLEAIRESLRRHSKLRRTRLVEHRLDGLLDRLRVGVFRATLGGRLMEANTALRRILGIPLGASLEEHRLTRVLAGQPHLVEQLQELFAKSSTVQIEDMALTRFDGEPMRASVHLVRTRVDGRYVVDGLLEDITVRKQTEAALEESSERYELAAIAGNDGIWDWNLVTGEVFLSPRWNAMLGLGDTKQVGAAELWFDRVHTNDRPGLEKQISAHIIGDTAFLQCEYRILHRDGSWRWMLCRGLALRDVEGRATRLAGSQTDITTRKEFEQRLIHGALYDTLTGLPNRELFIDRVEHAIGVRQRHPEFRYAVMMLDLDRFKFLNESFGHAAGDHLLIEVASRLEGLMRPADTLARLSGDEFAILLEEVDGVDQARTIADTLLASLQAPILIDDQEFVTTASVGVVLGGDDHERPIELLRDADTAMHRAKISKDGCFAVFAKGMHQQVMRRLRLENDLHRAIKREEFLLYYQPIIDLEAGRISGCEALLRWNHPERGLVSPNDFIPLAEETGLILPLGEWILRKACKQARAWRAHQPDFTVSVNLSSQQFRQLGLIDLLTTLLAEEGLGVDAIKLELTESTLMENADSTTHVLAALRDLDIKLLIDDFGTGYSSLSYLQHLESESIKIDRSFISRMGGDMENDEIVRTIVQLAQSLGMGVIAEGVETEHQLQILREYRCHFAQGFFFSRPVPAESFGELLHTNPRW